MKTKKSLSVGAQRFYVGDRIQIEIIATKLPAYEGTIRAIGTYAGFPAVKVDEMIFTFETLLFAKRLPKKRRCV